MIGVDSSELLKMNTAMAKYSNILPNSVATTALVKSAKPMLLAAKNYAPIGKKIAYKKAREGQKGNAYDRGGATRRDMRIKRVKAEGNEAARAIVGVSKKSGKVGWRTVFITRGTGDRYTKGRTKRKDGTPKARKALGRVRKNDFLKSAHDNTIHIVEMNFGKEMQGEVNKWVERNI